MSKFKPLADRIQIKPDEQKSHTGNFVIPDSAKEKPVTGTVVAVGPKVSKTADNNSEIYWKPNINVGDRVVYSSSAAVSVEIDGEVVTFLMERDCHLVISKEKGKYEPICEVGSDNGTNGIDLSFEVASTDIQILNDVPYVYILENDLITDPTTNNTGVIQEVKFTGLRCFVKAQSTTNEAWTIPVTGKVYSINNGKDYPR